MALLTPEQVQLPREITMTANERPLYVIRRSYKALAARITMLLIFLLALVGFFYLVDITLGIFFTVLIVMIGFLGYVVGYLYVNGHYYVITNERIIFFRKFITVIMRDVGRERITDLLVIQGLLGRLLGYGDIQVATAGMPATTGMIAGATGFVVSFKDVIDPYGLRAKLVDVLGIGKPA